MENLISCKFENLRRWCVTGWLTLLTLALFCDISPAEDKIDSKIPIHVVSDKMIAIKDKSLAEFTGHVTVTREDSILKADSIKIYFKSQTDPDTDNQIKEIVAQGNVEYTSADRKATADRAVYTSMDETLVLTGKEPRVTTGTSYVTGEKIIVYQKTDQVIVESGNARRVEAVFNPEDSKKN